MNKIKLLKRLKFSRTFISIVVAEPLIVPQKIIKST